LTILEPWVGFKIDEIGLSDLIGVATLAGAACTDLTGAAGALTDFTTVTGA